MRVLAYAALLVVAGCSTPVLPPLPQQTYVPPPASVTSAAARPTVSRPPTPSTTARPTATAASTATPTTRPGLRWARWTCSYTSTSVIGSTTQILVRVHHGEGSDRLPGPTYRDLTPVFGGRPLIAANGYTVVNDMVSTITVTFYAPPERMTDAIVEQARVVLSDHCGNPASAAAQR